ncbi:hypothetical protein BC829DRAFT_383115, partial [Chytridium lagenaria]
PRIDPNQIPSPLAVQEADQALHENDPYSTLSRTMPPLASSRFTAIDEGILAMQTRALLRFTTYQTSSLPLGAIIQPLADLDPKETRAPAWCGVFARPARPVSYVFALDVSWNSLQWGVLARTVATLKEVLFSEKFPKNARIGISNLESPQNAYVFVPLNEDFLVDPNESNFIGNANRIGEPVLGAVLQLSNLALKDIGGKAFVMQTSFLPSAPIYRRRAFGIDFFLFLMLMLILRLWETVSTLTGGDTYYYQNFDASRDGNKCSNGLKAVNYYGNFYMKNSTDIELAGIDALKTIGVELRHDGKLDEKAESKMDTTLNFIAKAYVSQASTLSLKAIREQLTDKCNIASSTAPGQVHNDCILFNSLALLKSKAFRGGPEMSTDNRVHGMRTLRSMSVTERSHGAYDERGVLRLPPQIRVSYERLDPSGLYLVENGQTMYLWVGRNFPPARLQAVFGVDKLESLDFKMRSLPVLNNPISNQVRSIISHIVQARPRFMQLQIVRHQLDPYLEVEFANFLIEDQNHDGMTYVDYLCFVHRNIQLEISSS